MTLIPYVFREFHTRKNLVRWMLQTSCFRRPFEKEHGKRSQTLLKPAGQHLYHLYWSLWRKLNRKKFLVVTCKIFGLFLNTLTSDDKYSLLNSDNLTQPIQMQLSKKQKTFSEFFSAFLKTISNFEHFGKEDDPHSLCISQITDSKKSN